MSTNKVTTDAIKKDRAQLEKTAAENLKKQSEQAKKQAEAKALVDALAGQVKAYNVDDIKIKTFQKLLTEEKIRNNNADKHDDLSAEQIRLAKEYLDSKEFKKSQKAALNDYARLEIMKIAGNDTKVNAIKDGKAKDQVQAELDRQLKNKEISEDEYNFLMEKSKTSGSFWEFLGIRKNKKIARVYDVAAKTNKRDQRQVELTTGTKEKQAAAVDKHFTAEMEAKLNQRGLTPQKLYEIFNAHGGAADATLNYSCKQIQPGEQHAILADLNSGRKEGQHEFTMSEAKEIAKALGYKWEKAVDPAIVARDMAYGALATPFAITSDAESTSIAGDGNIAKDQAIAKVPLPPISAGVAGLASVYKQYTRVEDRAIPDDVFGKAKTYEEYAAYLDDFATKDGASLGKQIGKYYVKDGVFLIDQLEKDLHHSAGTDGADQTPLNYEELTGLLTDLASGKKVIKAPEKKVDEPKQQVVVVTDVVKNEEVKIDHCSYEIKRGDHPYAIAQGLYGIKDHATALKVARYIKTLAKASDPAGKAEFWKVGTVIELPETIPGIKDKDGNDIVSNCDSSKVIPDLSAGDYRGASTGNGYKVGNETVSTTTYRTDVYDVDKDDKRTLSKTLKENETDKEKAIAAGNDYKKEKETDQLRIKEEDNCDGK